MTAVFIVKARVVDASAKDAFDSWYEKEHLPDAVKTSGAKGASHVRRMWLPVCRVAR